MSGGAKAIKIPIVVAAIISLLAVPAYSQGMGKKGGEGGLPPKTSQRSMKRPIKLRWTEFQRPNSLTILGARPARLTLRRQRASQLSKDSQRGPGGRRTGLAGRIGLAVKAESARSRRSAAYLARFLSGALGC